MATSGRSRFERASWVNVLGNAAKITVEAAIGIAFGSLALLADAAHSVADLIASIVVLIWGGEGYEDPDTAHPHGHDRFEPATALIVGGAIVLMGLLLFWQSVEGIYVGTDVQFSYLLIGALVFAIANMGTVYWYTMRVNATLHSTALRALAIDCKNDIYTSSAALVGIIGVWSGYSVFDPLAGALVSVLVMYQGVNVARENIAYLLGAAPPARKQREVRKALLAHPGVKGVHDLVVYYEGTGIEVEAHVEVDGELSLRAAHELESDLISYLRTLDEVRDAHLHLDPAGLGEWKDAAEPR